MDALHTPDSRFARISAYPYSARMCPVEGEELKLACVVEGAPDSWPMLLLSGGPTWSYLWRRVLPMLVEANCRIVVPDLVGMGQSDKPTAGDVGLERQLAWLLELCRVIDLSAAVLVFHGMSGLLGLRLLTAAPERFIAGVGVCPVFDRAGGEVAELCRRLREDQPLRPSELVAAGCAEPLSEAERAVYDAPFPEDEAGFTHALRSLPDLLAPNRDSWPATVGPVRVPLMAVSGSADRLAEDTGDWMERLMRPAAVPDGKVAAGGEPAAGGEGEGGQGHGEADGAGSPQGAGAVAADGAGTPPREKEPEAVELLRKRVTLAGAGHYAPEDRGSELALALLSFLDSF